MQGNPTTTPLDSTRNNTFAHWMKQLDRLLRGDATRLSNLRRGIIDVSPEGMTIIILALGAIYGACMGSYAIFQTRGPSGLQMLATIGKVPLLFLLTVLVTFPSLYVFNALVGSRLSLSSVFRLIIATVAVMIAILASLGPIVAFFSVSTTSYPFMLLLNIGVFFTSGFLGLKFLLSTLHRLTLVQDEQREETATSSTRSLEVAPQFETPTPIPAWNEPVSDKPAPLPIVPMANVSNRNVSSRNGALERQQQPLGRSVMTVFYTWILVFGLVGSQMSWVLRPFLGHPDKDFVLFAARESNFFEAVFNLLSGVLS